MTPAATARFVLTFRCRLPIAHSCSVTTYTTHQQRWGCAETLYTTRRPRLPKASPSKPQPAPTSSTPRGLTAAIGSGARPSYLLSSLLWLSWSSRCNRIASRYAVSLGDTAVEHQAPMWRRGRHQTIPPVPLISESWATVTAGPPGVHRKLTACTHSTLRNRLRPRAPCCWRARRIWLLRPRRHPPQAQL